ncbi:Uncharacterised protein [Serratia quinivorans]|uniref:hypothetical protein n=1 Tax=Serratia quinivorans TaxID=137545 RepID=UPI00217C1262|nr:hypothetical protein [Serratia quinivorans]CAI1902879.1 Uncharacterised protein [Serratia quinivorans]
MVSSGTSLRLINNLNNSLTEVKGTQKRKGVTTGHVSYNMLSDVLAIVKNTPGHSLNYRDAKVAKGVLNSLREVLHQQQSNALDKKSRELDKIEGKLNKKISDNAKRQEKLERSKTYAELKKTESNVKLNIELNRLAEDRPAEAETIKNTLKNTVKNAGDNLMELLDRDKVFDTKDKRQFSMGFDNAIKNMDYSYFIRNESTFSNSRVIVLRHGKEQAGISGGERSELVRTIIDAVGSHSNIIKLENDIEKNNIKINQLANTIETLRT